MKRLLLIFCWLLTFAAHSQGPIPRYTCGIWYDYDAAGNRIKRYYDCKDNYAGDHPPAAGSLVAPSDNPPANRGIQDTKATDEAAGSAGVTLYPNPTQDAFTIRLPKAGTHTHFHLYDAKGAILSSGNIDGDRYEGRLGYLPAGTYTVVIYYDGRSIAFKVTKI